MPESTTTLPDTLHTLTAPQVFGTGYVTQILDQISQAARAIVPVVTTAKGRKEIASLAAKVARSKTYLDSLGKDFVADLKTRAGRIDAERRQIRDTLDALRDEVRAPLTAWEQAEADRQQRHLAIIDRLADLGKADLSLSARQLQGLMDTASGILVDETLEEFQDQAQTTKDASLFRLRTLLDAAIAQEAEAARLEAERQAREQAAREERERQIAAAAAARAKAEAEATAKRRAAEQATRAERERQALQRQLADAKAKAEATARQAQDAARLAQERQAAAERQRQAEEAARQRDREHASQIRREARDSLMQATSLGEAVAALVIKAIHRGVVTHVAIEY